VCAGWTQYLESGDAPVAVLRRIRRWEMMKRKLLAKPHADAVLVGYGEPPTMRSMVSMHRWYERRVDEVACFGGLQGHFDRSRSRISPTRINWVLGEGPRARRAQKWSIGVKLALMDCGALVIVRNSIGSQW